MLKRGIDRGKSGSGGSGSKERIGKTLKKGLIFGPVGGEEQAKGSKMMRSPQGSAIGTPKGIEGPAAGARPPGGRNRRGSTQAPSTVAGQEQKGVDPGTPLDGGEGGNRAPALFLTQAEAALDLAMANLEFPTLPGPE